MTYGSSWDYGFEVGDIPVVYQGDTLDFAWTGGLDCSAMWSPIDLDFDGYGFVCFDRDGHDRASF